MRYQGGKVRLGKTIANILKTYRQPGQVYVEPFLGACGVMRHMDGPRIGGDANADMIAHWKAIQDGWQGPKYLSREEYDFYKANPHYLDFSPALRAHIAIGCSYSGKLWGGYASGENRNFSDETRRASLKVGKTIQGVKLYARSFDGLPIPDNSLIYCDPPYANTTGYKATGDFNHDYFWSWCRAMTKVGHTVIVSEYTAPDDIVCIWTKKTTTSLALAGKQAKRVEKLFKV